MTLSLPLHLNFISCDKSVSVNNAANLKVKALGYGFFHEAEHEFLFVNCGKSIIESTKNAV